MYFPFGNCAALYLQTLSLVADGWQEIGWILKLRIKGTIHEFATESNILMQIYTVNFTICKPKN